MDSENIPNINEGELICGVRVQLIIAFYWIKKHEGTTYPLKGLHQMLSANVTATD